MRVTPTRECLSLLVLRYVDETRLSDRLRRFDRYAIPSAAILLPVAFFLSVLLRPDATEPNALIYLAYVGALLLAFAFITLGIGIIRNPKTDKDVFHEDRAA